MFRPVVSVISLVMCLNLLVAMAGDSPSPQCDRSRLPSDENITAESLVSGIEPVEHSGRVPRADFSGHLSFPLLITNEPADIQSRASCLALGDWQRFARVPATLFSDSRSLPLEI